MRAWAAVATVCVVAVLGCRKPSGKAFYEFNTQYELLVARDGDAAYAQPDMDSIVQGLSSVPEGAAERGAAQAVLQKITAARQRIAAEEEAAKQVVERSRADTTPTMPSYFENRGAPVPPPPAALRPAGDAGVKIPTLDGNLDEKALALHFAGCFDPGVAGPLPQDDRRGVGYTIRGSADCRRRMGLSATGEVVLFFVDGHLAKQLTRSQVPPAVPEPRIIQVLVDAGPLPEPRMTFPGAPRPELPPPTVSP